jgi:hypothetical protein
MNQNSVLMPVMPEKKRKAKKVVTDDTPSVWNPEWKYTPAEKTDLAKKFRRIQREQKATAAAKVRRIK